MSPSLNADPWLAALEDLRSWVEQPMWGATRLLRRAVLRHRYGLRWAAGWVIAPDCYAHIEAFVYPRETPRQGLQLRGMPNIPDECALPGQRYLRIGEVTAASTGNTSYTLDSRVWETAINSWPPHSALAERVGRGGIAWYDRDTRPPPPEYLFDYDQAPLDRMAHLLHDVLDQPLSPTTAAR
ncbi:hypothetical protein SAMN04489747_2492 [Auraticoccus monumenti]|uniref:Uncharacterized protein n=2 Tax=Auraticoccus monumenti TaxID=675864 RepID=A0A1G7A643_9ACTN|nr:hypothetical protein SAMN04489747_2492 [Auraticoccus monumenti]